MELFDELVTNGSFRTISVVGLAKNTGKTTTINHIIRAFSRKGSSLGVTSTGRDGEEFDALTSSIKKPPIDVPSGTIIATGSEYIRTYLSDVKILVNTNYRTQMGTVVICQVKKHRRVLLAGPVTNSGINDVKKIMLDLGCSAVLIDGSINRLSVTTPDISDSVMFTTGASVHEEMSSVIEKTREVIDRYKIEDIETKYKSLIQKEIIKSNKIALIYEDLSYELISSIIGVTYSDRIVRHLNDSVKYVFIPGAFFEDDATSVVNSDLGRGVTFIVEDGSKIFFDIGRYHSLGLCVKTLKKAHVSCITANPVYPTYYSFNGDEFLSALRRQFHNIPVFDLGPYCKPSP